MKKSTLASLISVASLAVTVSSYAQGSVQFQNYDFGAAGLNAPVTFGTSGVRVGSEFRADLLYSLDGGATFNLLTAAQSGNAQYPAVFAFGVGADGDAANFAGYFFGNPVTIPGYTSGPISFIVEAWTGGSSYATATGPVGRSAPFTMPSIATGTTQPPNFTGLSAFTVNPVPEPTVFALAGIGVAVWLVVCRKK